MHVILLGDSILDNEAYTGGEPGVAAHLERVLGDTHQVTLLAVDGSRTVDVKQQLLEIPPDATHLVLSSGGNDALEQEPLLGASVRSGGEALARLAGPVADFAARYDALARELAATRLPLLFCTIYDGNLPEDEAVAARVAVAVYNDTVQRVAREVGADVLELRSVCRAPSDYANPIEPSGSGGRKIAEAIASAVRRRD